MTTRPTDDPLQRDPRFDAAWRTASSEEPPPALDAAILAAARREVGAKPQSLAAANAAMRARRRWWPLAAAATVAVIAIGVVQRAGHDELVAPPGVSSIVTDMPAQIAKSIAEAPQRAPETLRGDDGRRRRRSRRRRRNGRRARACRFPCRVASRARASTLWHSREPAGARGRVAPQRADPRSTRWRRNRKASRARRLRCRSRFRRPRRNAGAAAPRDATAAASAAASTGDIAPAAPEPQAAPSPPSAASPSSMPLPPAASFADSARVAAPSAMRSSPIAKTATAGAAEEARIKDRAPLPVTDWIALIRRLRDEGKTVEAARELGAFRTAHADHEKLLPPDLRDWHPAEK